MSSAGLQGSSGRALSRAEDLSMLSWLVVVPGLVGEVVSQSLMRNTAWAVLQNDAVRVGLLSQRYGLTNTGLAAKKELELTRRLDQPRTERMVWSRRC